jgi:colicin import membrane protein
MIPGRARRLPGGRKAFVYAVLVHLALIAIVVVGVRWQARPAAPAKVIQAQVVGDAETRKELERRKQQERERDLAEARKKREQQEHARQAAEEQRRQEQARLVEQKRKDEAKRQAAAAEKKRKDEARQAEARKKKDAEERRRAAESSLKEQSAHEERERGEARAKAEQAQRVQSARERFEKLVVDKVNRNWVRLPSWPSSMVCVLRVRLNPTGEVIDVTPVRSSGNPAFDRSVENAVYKASPFRLPEDKALFEHVRELELTFHPPEEKS